MMFDGLDSALVFARGVTGEQNSDCLYRALWMTTPRR